MVDTFVDKLFLMLISEVDKKLAEICEKLPELLANRRNVTLCEQDDESQMGICKKYSIEYCGEERAYFCVGLSRDDKGKLQVKASDVVYL